MRRMRYGQILLGWLAGLGFLYAAALPPLRIGVPHFYPPYILEGENRTVTGFDVLFMTRLCEEIHRACVFVPMNNADIISAVAHRKVDLGMGAITITLERYRFVNFSIPYLLSESRFLGKRTVNTTPFRLEQFNHKTIGVTAGTTFAQQLTLMHGVQETVRSFPNINELVGALNDGTIDLALMDDATARYWEMHSSNQLQALGQSFVYGFGIGIAMHRDDTALTKVIDLAILMEQDSAPFKQLYNIYFGSF